MTAADIAHGLPGCRKSGRGYVAYCPAHEGDGKRHTPSLSIAEHDGRPLVYCCAGCPQEAVIAALRARGLWPERPRPDWTPEQRRAWVRERRDMDRDLLPARWWRDAALLLADEVMDTLKLSLWGVPMPWEPHEAAAELGGLWRWRESIRMAGDAALVAEFRWWREHYPKLTAGLVHAGRARERRLAATILHTVTGDAHNAAD